VHDAFASPIEFDLLHCMFENVLLCRQPVVKGASANSFFKFSPA
jgi:hypothetical protein